MPKRTPEVEAEERASFAALRLLPGSNFASDLLRYEMRLERQLSHAYRLLTRLKANDQFKITTKKMSQKM